MLASSAGLLAGCRSVPTFSDNRPKKTVIRIDGIELRSDVPLPRSHPLVEELAELRVRLSHTLRVEPGTRPVVVYLFGDEGRYSSYMAEHFPGLPNRRAFFVGTPGELAVYAFWGASIDADLRHECTHGLLHSSLGEVPLWLDEGIAEYFETDPRAMRRVNTDHVDRLRLALRNGWRPDMPRLESLQTVDQMSRADYQEAWAWVHFLMHESMASRDLLMEYLHALPDHDTAPPLSEMVTQKWPIAQERMVAHLSTL